MLTAALRTVWLDDCFNRGLVHPEQTNLLLLRIIAASLVIYGHSFDLAAHDPTRLDFFARHVGYRYCGDIGVAVFFLLSGFLVSASYHRGRKLLVFLNARLFRLLPALAACVALSALLLGPLLTSLEPRAYFRAPETWRYFQNILLAHNEWTLPGVFTFNHYQQVVNGSLWTLPIEARAYLLTAVLGAVGLLHWRGVGGLAWLAVLVATLAWPGDINRYLGFDAARLLAFFAVGGCFYFFARWIPIALPPVLALMLLAWALRHGPYYEPALACCVIYAVFWLAYVPVIPLPHWLGDISYGTYLWGFPVQQLIAHFAPGALPWQMMLLALPLSWLLGAASWRWVEEPAMRLRKRLEQAARRRSATLRGR